MSNTRLNVAGIVRESVVDGPGIRYVIFTQGCPHNCDGCHNQQSIPFGGGRQKDIDEIFAEIQKNPLLSGVTFSGGEPFEQAKPLARLAERLKTAGTEIAAYTGYTFEELSDCADADKKYLLSLIDTLIDGRFVKEQKNWELKFKGSENQRVIDVKRSLKAGRPVLDDTPRWN